MLSIEFLFLALLVMFLFCVYDCSKPRKFPPGPIWLPFVGCLPQFQLVRAKCGYVHLAFEKLAKYYGPILGVKLGHQKFVVVSSHELVKKVLRKDEFNGRPDGFFFRVRSFGARKGVIFTEGTTWSYNRRLTMKHLRAFGFGQPSMQEEIAREARALVEHLHEKGKDEKPLPMHAAFDVPVLNALWTMLAGHRFSYDDPELQEVLEVVHNAFRLFSGGFTQIFVHFCSGEKPATKELTVLQNYFCGFRLRLIFRTGNAHKDKRTKNYYRISDTLGGMVSQVPLLRHVIPELSGYNDLMSVLEKLWKFIGDEVDKHEAKMRCRLQEPTDLIDAFVLEMINSEKDSTLRTFDRQDILVLCLDLFMAGFKTTTDALAMTFAFLGNHIEWLKLLQGDLDSVIGRDRDPVLEDTVLMPRVEAFLAESQRTLILTPLGVPHNTTKNVSFEGYEIPKDTTILVNFHSAHNDTSVWYKPNEFFPERFLDKNGKFNRTNDFMQFGLGKRRCLGETLARSSLFLFFTYVVHHFDIIISEKHGPPCLEGIDGFVISPKPYHLILTRRLTRK